MRVFPLDIFEVDLERLEIRDTEFAGQHELRAKDDRLINSTMQFLGLNFAHDIDCIGEKIGFRDRRLLHFATLHLAVGSRHFLDRFETILIRDD
jgi:hypothetical protein